MNFRRFSRTLIAGSAILISLFLSYVRENTFLIINGVITGEGSYKANVEAPLWLVNSFSRQELLYLKWPLTLLFCLLFALVTWLAIRFLFKNEIYHKVVLWVYALLFAVGLVFLASTFILGTFSTSFKYIRMIFAIVQSPVLMLVYIALFHTANRLQLLKAS